jgi:hypothetical protein
MTSPLIRQDQPLFAPKKSWADDNYWIFQKGALASKKNNYPHATSYQNNSIEFDFSWA